MQRREDHPRPLSLGGCRGRVGHHVEDVLPADAVERPAMLIGLFCADAMGELHQLEGIGERLLRLHCLGAVQNERFSKLSHCTPPPQTMIVTSSARTARLMRTAVSISHLYSAWNCASVMSCAVADRRS